MEQTSADMIVRSGNLTELKDADSTKPGKTIWYFDHIPNTTRCFEHTVNILYTFLVFFREIGT